MNVFDASSPLMRQMLSATVELQLFPRLPVFRDVPFMWVSKKSNRKNLNRHCQPPESVGQGWPKKIIEIDADLVSDLESLIEPQTRGDPQSPLRWTCKSLRNLADELRRLGHKVSHTHVGKILTDLGYSLQANKKTLEGSSHPDRNAQFEFINRQVEDRLKREEPVISVDTKKKELIGRFKNNGQTWRPKGEPEEVKVHDFMEEAGRASPYGVYDIRFDEGWVRVCK